MEAYTHFVVTPWRNSRELIQLRRDLYRLNDDEVDCRQAAVNKVLAWRAGHESLPLLLESTADMVDVILQDEAGILNHNASRLLYATAISRFITGYLDTQIDLTRDRPSWFPPGKSLQPPVSLLQVRHCIVHRHMPSLAELKRASRTALDWLWEWYWAQLEHAFGLPASLPTNSNDGGADADVGIAEKLQSMLRTYVKARKQEIKAKRRADLCTAAETAWTVFTLRSRPAAATTLPSTAAQTALLRLLVQDTHILPADKKLASTMSGAFLVWSPFLLTFISHSPSFFPDLVRLVVEQMNGPCSTEAESEGLCEWAIHMLASGEWKEARGTKGRAIREQVLGECMTELGRWNVRLAEEIVDAMEEGEGDMWRAIVEAGRSEGGEGVVVDRVDKAKATVEMEGDMGVDRVEKARATMEMEGGMGVDVEGDKFVEAVLVEGDKRGQVSDPIQAKDKIAGPQKVIELGKPKPIGWLPDGWDEDA